MPAKQDAAKDRTDWARERTLLAMERRLLGRLRIGLLALGLALALKTNIFPVLDTRVVQAIIFILLLAAVGILILTSRGAKALAIRQSSALTSTGSAKKISVLAHMLIISVLIVGAILMWL